MIADICPILSIGKAGPVECTHSCAWFDTELAECAVSRINGALKNLESLNEIPGAINALDSTTEKLSSLISKGTD